MKNRLERAVAAGIVVAQWLGVALLAMLLPGCSTPTEHALRIAHRAQLTAVVVEGVGFSHQVFFATRAGTHVLYVFLDGDGSPWSPDGTVASDDPTPRKPLALQLAARTPHSVLYVGRPCAFGARRQAACNPEVWTSGRYSARVVQSLSGVINRHVESSAFGKVVLIGYSGGGALAVLVAPHVPTTAAVVTIAADLDVAAWAQWHGYLPLVDSLNPATQPPLADTIVQLHLLGDGDRNVPETLNTHYLAALPAGDVWRLERFDHVCCWVKRWPQLLQQIDSRLGIEEAAPAARAPSPHRWGVG